MILSLSLPKPSSSAAFVHIVGELSSLCSNVDKYDKFTNLVTALYGMSGEGITVSVVGEHHPSHHATGDSESCEPNSGNAVCSDNDKKVIQD